MDATEYTSNWLCANDLNKPETDVTIKNVTSQVLEDKDKLVLEFEDKVKDMTVNTTNTKTLIELFGKETEDWEAKKICLYKVKTSYKGKEVDGIRVKASNQSKKDAETFMN